MYVPDMALAGLSDDDLVVRAQQNDNAAFAELVRRTSPTAMRIAMSILRDPHDAEDELQNTYWKAWRHVNQFHRESAFSTWISRIVLNQCFMRLRGRRGGSWVYLDDAEGPGKQLELHVQDRAATPEDRLGAREISALLQREIRRLPPLLRDVLVLRDVQERTTAEAAGRLSISAAAVKSRLLRARLELRSRLEKYCGPSGPTTVFGS